jgi:hypothetical protein
MEEPVFKAEASALAAHMIDKYPLLHLWVDEGSHNGEGSYAVTATVADPLSPTGRQTFTITDPKNEAHVAHLREAGQTSRYETIEIARRVAEQQAQVTRKRWVSYWGFGSEGAAYARPDEERYHKYPGVTFHDPKSE